MRKAIFSYLATGAILICGFGWLYTKAWGLKGDPGAGMAYLIPALAMLGLIVMFVLWALLDIAGRKNVASEILRKK